MEMIKTWLKQLLTENDNQTADLFRVVTLLGVVMFIVYAGINLHADPAAWNPISYGTGFAAVLAGAGAALRIKDGPANGGKATDPSPGAPP